jgi:hypothetical protein
MPVLKGGFGHVSKGMGARLSGKRTKLLFRSLAADSNPWDGFWDCTTHRQGNGGRKTVSEKGTKTPSRRQTTIPDNHGSGRHSGHQASRDRTRPNGVGRHGRSRQAVAGTASRREEVRGGQGQMLQTVKDACKFDPKAIDYALSDEIENLDDLVDHDTKAAETFFGKTGAEVDSIAVSARSRRTPGHRSQLSKIVAGRNWPSSQRLDLSDNPDFGEQP